MSAIGSVSVVVPVKDGGRYLAELLAAIPATSSSGVPVDVLIVDSGSTDGSCELARATGARVVEIEPSTFQHGRTRNLGAEWSSGDVIAFLTQDATPVAGWVDALLAGFALADDVGIVFGPHLARPDTSPMIARELAAFFATKAAPDGGPQVERAGGDAWLSNVNAAYRRDCWAAVRFPEVPYAEDQGFAGAALEAGWAKAYVPDAAVLHAHDYPPVQFARRYFDEYRGLRETIGHVEHLGVRSTTRTVRDLVAGDRAWMREQGYAPRDLARWTARSGLHHASRQVFAALGSRAHGMPPAVQRRLSLEGTVGAADPGPLAAGRGPRAPISGKPIGARPVVWDAVRRYARDGAAPLLDPLPGQDTDAPLHIACVIPPFDRGSGGHNSIFQTMWRLEQAGHTVSIWINDEHGHKDYERPARIRRDIREWFAPIEGPVFKEFDEWFGADVVVATGWQTAHEVVLLPNCRSRVYLIHDHESEFYATSVESRFAEASYGLDMHMICSSPWLQEIVSSRYGRTSSLFDFGVDHDVYRPIEVPRQESTILFYGRDATPRRAVSLAKLALRELADRGLEFRVLSFGNDAEIDMPVPYEHLGVRDPHELAQAYNEATVGLVLSLTNYSLIPQEMLACGLPCVDLEGISAEGVFGADGPVSLSPFDPIALADRVERLLTDRAEWQRRHEAGLAFVQGRTWDVAARQVEAGIREALALRLAAPSR
ncbi:glycosyltransferase [Conexibacter sp. W3-3-2]|uniref:glycosyltransferase n=1 Tax=Conexibacter sp. W3-3-2 TaxID=2675227 RepID=UPI0012B9DA3D|nr:glycosyltransferase [Conexibacter sp. W3-3-2]MTD46230.1 glycosyltransferase [Conexibacter sp. W3-3-2]